MEAILTTVRGLTPHQHFFLGLSAAFIFGKSHFYRTVRYYGVPIVIAVIAYRVLKTNDPSLLEIINHAISTADHGRAFKIIIGDLFGLLACLKVLDLADKVFTLDLAGLYRGITDFFFNLVKSTPMVQEVLAKEQENLEVSIGKDLKTRSRALGEMITKLPVKPMKEKAILKLMKDAATIENEVWESGHLSGAVYNGLPDHTEFLNKCFSVYSVCNPLHPEIWPSVMKFDSEVVAMTASLVDGGVRTVCGTSSSGGTDSIILAIKAHRDYYRDNFGITNPELVCGVSAHAAVDKACDMLKIRLIKVPLHPISFKVSLSSLRRAIGPNTIMIYSSAPNYPYGTIDDIKAMSKIACEFNIGLHVDCCLGGFILPFAKKLGYNVPEFDFSLPGVTSMSLDTHKYGYALKGASVVLYRTKELRHSQYFCYADWTGGMYTTPGIAGSRSGGLIAQCWASLMSIGEEGYMRTTDDIMKLVKEITVGISKIDGIYQLGEANAMIVCFAAVKGLNIYSIGDKMSARGWHMNPLQNPPCVHICCTVHHVGKAQVFLKDLEDSIKELRATPVTGALEGKAGIYGSCAGLPPGPVNELLKAYNDVVYKV